MQAVVYPSKNSGTVKIPPSKSVAHRAIICACLAEGTSVIRNVSESDDMKATIGAMQALGAKLARSGDTLTIEGTGGVPKRSFLKADCIESGSTLRFLIPLFSLTGGNVSFSGSRRLMERPQSVYESLFREQGLFFQADGANVSLCGALKSGGITLRGDISSQFITGLLFTLPLLSGDSVIRVLPPFESRSYIELTLGVLRAFGVHASFSDEYTLHIPGKQRYRACEYPVEGDYSQLAFFAVRGAVGVKTVCEGIRTDSVQGDRVICEFVRRAGANVIQKDDTVTISPARLSGQEFDLADCPDLGPVLMVLAAFCEDETRLVNAGRLRVKESDRIAAMEEELSKLGVTISSTADTVTISGRKPMNSPVSVYAHNDHRIAMSLAVFASAAEQPVTILGAECVKKSYPDFFEALRKANVKAEVDGI